MAKANARKATSRPQHEDSRSAGRSAARATRSRSQSKPTDKRGRGQLENRARTTRTSTARHIAIKPGATALFEVPAEVERVVAALGSNTVADVLGVARSQPTRWRKGEERISPTNRARLSDLDHVLNRLLQVLYPEEAGAWLTALDPHLGGRPVDVLSLRGAGPVIEAIDGLAQGAYA